MDFLMGKNTLITEKLLSDVYRLIYFLHGTAIPVEARVLCVSIEAEIADKIAKKQIRNAFSAYKMAPPGPQRESLRQEYIKLAQIHRCFISGQEIPYSSL
jgi:hypothetical protein